MRKLSICISMLIMAAALMSCASMMSNEGTAETRAVADYSQLSVKLADTRSNIDSLCPTATNPLSPADYTLMSETSCRKAKRIFNIANKAYIMAGEYLNIAVDPDNTAIYMKNIASGMALLLKTRTHEADINALIDALDVIVEADHDDPYRTADMILVLALNRIVPAVANIMQPYIVEDDK